ncbi:hypothetical protein [Winogradskyella sp. MIT101101]|uniref:hypothetical protein n=1 Tax=Winogradskyella sp. MIT101101 TaxID=3098297 RepID=UPI003999A9F2
MKTYTKEQANSLLNEAIKNFNVFTKDFEFNYSNFLNGLNDENYKSSLKISLAFEEKQKYRDKMQSFIQTFYDKSDEIIINGLTYYTVETWIFIELSTTHLSQIDKKLNILYSKFLKSFDGSNP